MNLSEVGNGPPRVVLRTVGCGGGAGHKREGRDASYRVVKIKIRVKRRGEAG